MPPSQYSRTQVNRPGWRAHVAAVLLFSAFVVGVATPAFAQHTSPGAVVVLKVRGVIDPVVAQYVEQGIHTAEKADAALVVIRLDTPGGLDTAMRDIVQDILNSDVPVAVFVAPPGARAASAGVFIAMAAHVAAMAPGTNIGAAHPVNLGEGEMPSAVESKATNDAAAYIRAIAQERGRNADWAEEAVRQSASLTAQQALERQVVELMADDLPDLVAKLDGRTMTVKGSKVTLELATAAVEEYPMTWLQVIAHSIADPNIAYILLTLGTTALIAEFYHPGAILPGVTGVISLILAFTALGSLPVNWGGIALILVAFVFFILDIKVAGFALSVAGAISFVLGSLLLFSPFRAGSPSMPRLSVNPWLLGGMTALIVGFFGIALTAALRAQKQTALMSTQRLVGAIGIAVSDLDPQGVIQIQSETWTAIADPGPVSAGESVEVVETEGLRLRVRRPG